jgi:alkaline phosphatase
MRRRLITTFVAALTLTGCGEPSDSVEADTETNFPGGKADGVDDAAPTERPRRVILMIGDGMGVGSVSAAAYAGDAPLHMLSMPRVSFMTTHEHEFITTDSAASATAMATGVKTHFEGVGVRPGATEEDEEHSDQQLFTLLDAARETNRRTGVVTTASIVDATPAAFTAHRAKRRSRDDIAVDIRNSGVDVLLGGGRSRFDDRGDGQNLINQMRADGYAVANTAIGLRRHSGSKTQVIGLLHDDDMPEVVTGERVMPLAELVAEAITILDTENPEGYVLVVEGAQIDRRGHVLDGPGNVAETLDFDAAIGVALDYARGRDDTLVVVTADHETGGVTVLDAPAAEPMVEALGGRETALAEADFPGGGGYDAFSAVPSGSLAPTDDDLILTHGDMSTSSRPFYTGLSRFYRAAHTPVMVPLFAEGVGAEYVARSTDNAELGARLLALVEAPRDEEEPPAPEPEETSPKNLVLVLGDGVGLPTWTAAHYAAGMHSLQTLPTRGLASTHASDRILGDAASAAVAWSTGRAGARGQTRTDAVSLLQRAEDAGRSTGLVSTASAVSPGLLPFFGGDADAAARSMAEFDADGDGLDVVFAGGSEAFDDAALEAWAARDADVELGWNREFPASGPAVRLIAPAELPPAGGRNDEPTLGEMTLTALDRLAQDDDGFVLVVYAPGVAERAADLTFDDSLLAELADLDGALSSALDFAAERDDTLVVVSSMQDGSMSILDNHYGFHKNHCGVAERCDGPETLVDLALAFGEFVLGPGFDDEELQGDFSDLSVILQGAWLPYRSQLAGAPAEVHSANFVPVFAQGPGSQRLGGMHHQAELGRILGELLAD